MGTLVNEWLLGAGWILAAFALLNQLPLTFPPPSHFAALFSWLFLRTARQGAQSVLYAALDMNLDYITGHYIE